jgi:hypothetical protein
MASPKKQDVVGRGSTGSSTPTPSASTAPKYDTKTLNDVISGKLKNVNVKVDTKATGTESLDALMGLSQGQLGQLAVLIKKFGASKPDYTSAEGIVAYVNTNYPVAVKNAGGDFNKLVTLLSANYIPTAVAPTTTGTGKSTFITQVDPKHIADLIDQTFLTTLGRAATDTEKTSLSAPLIKAINKGTTTTSVKDKAGNVVTTQTAAPSDASMQLQIEEAAKKNTEDYQRQQGADFFKWITQLNNTRGGQ